MAAKRNQKMRWQWMKPVVAVVAGLAIAAAALAALLGSRPLGTKRMASPGSVSGRQIAGEPERDHDRDQIDQESRDRLREILRAETSRE